MALFLILVISCAPAQSARERQIEAIIDLAGLNELESRFQTPAGDTGHFLGLDLTQNALVLTTPPASYSKKFNLKERALPAGCSLLPITPELADRLRVFYTYFTTACERLDFCYVYGLPSYKNTPKDCVRTFERDLKLACAATSPIYENWKRGCYKTAAIALLAGKMIPRAAFLHGPYCDYKKEPDKCKRNRT